MVVTDRYVDSMLAYQGAGRALDPDEVEDVAAGPPTTCARTRPWCSTSSPSTGSAVRRARPDRAESLEFHQRVREGFLQMAKADPDHYLVLDARGDVDDIEQQVRAAVVPLLARAVRR